MSDLIGAMVALFLVAAVIAAVALPLAWAIQWLCRLATPRAGLDYSPPRFGILGCFFWFVIFGLLVFLLLPSVECAREAARRSQCTCNLKQIGLALFNYADKYGSFPPAYTVNATGRPLHSWRVLLLPFMEQGELYKQLRMDEPWDSAHNLRVFTSPGTAGPLAGPSCFRCASDLLSPDAGSPSETNYVAIVGPRTIFPGAKSVRQSDITDGTSNTIAVVETYGLGIRWYEPRDLRAEEMSFQVNDPDLVSIASRHPGGANVGLADGSVRFFSEKRAPRIVEAMTTISGKEELSPGELP